jgi:DNA-directed RNA polymerase specialized sigma24 family protein
MQWDDHFEAFVREHTTALYRTALVLTRDGHRAADLVQETLTRLDRVLGADSPTAYARRALVNQFLSGPGRSRATSACSQTCPTASHRQRPVASIGSWWPARWPGWHPSSAPP